MAQPIREAIVVTVSTRASAGNRPDTVGPELVTRLARAGWDVVSDPVVVADDERGLTNMLTGLAAAGHRLVLTTGGTGLTPTDRTPEATANATDLVIPGLAEMMRAAGAASTPLAALSRGMVAARGTTLIVNLPGSPAGAMESLEAVLPVLRHASDQLRGGDHH